MEHFLAFKKSQQKKLFASLKLFQRPVAAEVSQEELILPMIEFNTKAFPQPISNFKGIIGNISTHMLNTFKVN